MDEGPGMHIRGHDLAIRNISYFAFFASRPPLLFRDWGG